MTADAFKRQAAEAAAKLVESGMVVGLGSGSTAELAIRALALRVRAGLRVVGIPTSERSAGLARELGIELVTFAERRRVDLAIDGADEVEEGTLNLLKGLGGALLREKIVASASARFITVADEGKLVRRLGTRAPVPVEVVPFGWEVAADRLGALGARPTLRADAATGAPFVTDGGHFVLDCAVGPIADPGALDRAIAAIPGVVGTGLFVGMAAAAVVAGPGGVRTLTPAPAAGAGNGGVGA